MTRSQVLSAQGGRMDPAADSPSENGQDTQTPGSSIPFLEALPECFEGVIKSSMQWVEAFVVVTFDLDYGPKFSSVIPNGYDLPNGEVFEHNICHLSFPDSNSAQFGDAVFSFRLPCKTNHDIIPAMEAFDSLFGFVFFRQQPDSAIHRGCMQESVVALTRLPLKDLFYDLMSHIGTVYFDEGRDVRVLERALVDIHTEWPAPTFDGTFDVHCLDRPYRFQMPTPWTIDVEISNISHTQTTMLAEAIRHSDKHGSGAYSLAMSSTRVSNYGRGSRLENILSTTYDDLRSLSSLWPCLWHLWEIVLTNEPLIFVGKSPTTVASLVHACLSLVSPLDCNADWRPYFTVHDSSFSELFEDRAGIGAWTQAVMVGVTNPYFFKLLARQSGTDVRPRFPHVLVMCAPQPTVEVNKARILTSLKDSQFHEDMDVLCTTMAKPTISVDRDVLRRLIPPSTQSEMSTPSSEMKTNAGILRRYFHRLTESFLQPLRVYVQAMMSSRRRPFLRSVRMTFDREHFLDHLKSPSTALDLNFFGLRTREEIVPLYQRFLHSRNFNEWLDRQCRDLYRQNILYLHVSSIVGTGNVSEIELVDRYLQLRRALEEEVRRPIVDIDIVEKLKDSVKMVSDVLKSMMSRDKEHA